MDVGEGSGPGGKINTVTGEDGIKAIKKKKKKEKKKKKTQQTHKKFAFGGRCQWVERGLGSFLVLENCKQTQL